METDKIELQKRKAEIQLKFKTQLGLLVDRPKSDGSGSTNDGNTAGRFFRNVKASAEIINIDEKLLQNLVYI